MTDNFNPPQSRIVTAKGASPRPGVVQYRFASNNRSTKALENVQMYITDILKTIGHAPESIVKSATPQSAPFSEVLQKILQFNRPRIESYTRMATIQIGVCIDRASRQETDDAYAASRGLNVLRPLVEFAASIPRGDNAEFIAATQAVLYAIDESYHSDSHPLKEFLRCNASVYDEGPDTPWTRLRYALGRLHSYLNAVKVFFSARRLWPSLFVNFEVIPIPSSKPDLDKLAIRTTAARIFHLMTGGTMTAAIPDRDETNMAPLAEKHCKLGPKQPSIPF
ncbi:hypothetical protein MMYC01_203501 [Madurella mycetomatis]|uniref:Uncharacterized protein n=1 Tax=Madurella mycetomatis TaxID=100816 RepID=A0A175W752_9PEZI|nr:hypothetical protein MMYC01_203501 [Madurella mycetomatis]